MVSKDVLSFAFLPSQMQSILVTVTTYVLSRDWFRNGIPLGRYKTTWSSCSFLLLLNLGRLVINQPLPAVVAI